LLRGRSSDLLRERDSEFVDRRGSEFVEGHSSDLLRDAILIRVEDAALQFAGGDASLGLWKDADLRREFGLLKTRSLLC